MVKLNTIIFISVLFLISCSSNRNLLPQEFFGLRLNKMLQGVEAKNYVDRIHLQEVAPDKNEIGFYESPAGKAIIYITYYSDDSLSVLEYERMINKISPENSVFTDPGFVEIKGKKIFKCLGMGQSHFVFTHRNELFWISCDIHFDNKFIEEYLDYIN